MEKKIDAIISKTLVGALDEINRLQVPKEDIVNVFQDNIGQYIAVFYK